MDMKKVIGLVREDLKRFEGLRLKPYRCTEGKLTIGYGRNLEDMGLTPAEAQILLEQDVDRCISAAIKMLPAAVSEVVVVVVSEMIFQLGYEGTRLFKRFFEAIEALRYKDAALELRSSLWAKQTPNRVKYLAGLLEGIK